VIVIVGSYQVGKNRVSLKGMYLWGGVNSNMMMMYQPFPRIRYVSPYSLGLALLCWREATFLICQIVDGLSSLRCFHLDSLECWCLGHETALSVSAWGDQTWGISGRYSVAKDATCMGQSRNAS